jgi:TolA-binding protein
MGYDDEALQQVRSMLESYPNSKYSDEAKTLMSNLLIRTNNYAEALQRLNEVNNQTTSYWAVYQKVTYGYAVQQFQQANYNVADSFFSLSLKHPADINYEAAANFWKGELAYRQHHFDNTIAYTNKFLNAKASPAVLQKISPMATQQHAYMNLGYAAMEANNYGQAKDYFSRASQLPGEDTSISLTAMLQEADASFMQKDYAKALSLYDRVATSNNSDADYARFQKAVLLGLQNRSGDKVRILQYLVDKNPPSAYAPNARYELAVTYIEQNKYQAAINTAMPLTEGFNGRNFAPKAWIKIGFSYQQMDNDDKAIEAYKKVITEYPQSEQRNAALDALRNLYIDNNNPGGYAKLLQENNIPNDGMKSFDSTYYAAAEGQFAAGKWENAKQSMSKYLEQYPNGAFTIKAHYYRGESNFQLKNFDAALPDFDTVLTAPWSDFSENSARRAAFINLHNKNYPVALKDYKTLRNNAMGQGNLQVAYTGLMMSSFSTDQYSDAAAYADTLIAFPGISEDAMQDALLYKAKSLQQLNKNDEVLPIYTRLDTAKNSTTAAESRYHIGEIYLAQGKLKEAETAANESIKKSAGNDYWIVKSYILLADVLTKEKDYFNAKATLQSIIKHTKIPELKAEATKKLDAVKEEEKAKSKLSDE